jgi:hypothetical protein
MVRNTKGWQPMNKRVKQEMHLSLTFVQKPPSISYVSGHSHGIRTVTLCCINAGVLPDSKGCKSSNKETNLAILGMVGTPNNSTICTLSSG